MGAPEIGFGDWGFIGVWVLAGWCFSDVVPDGDDADVFVGVDLGPVGRGGDFGVGRAGAANVADPFYTARVQYKALTVDEVGVAGEALALEFHGLFGILTAHAISEGVT